ncbi:MAG: site-specific integrase [Gemmataceae bacterium]
MARTPKKDRINCQYFCWLLGNRDGVFFADGRGNSPNLGRHSLGTRVRSEALLALRQLDLTQAVKLGRADHKMLNFKQEEILSLGDGLAKYKSYLSRPPVQGGVTPNTLKRYRAVFDKFQSYCRENRVVCWQEVTEDVLNGYGHWLESEDYHDRTQNFELTTLKQALNWFILKNLLPQSCQFRIELNKSKETTTYCYSTAEVTAIIDFCRANRELNWLADVVTTLAITGLRISELANLRWENIDLEKDLLKLTDRSLLSRRSERDSASRTKSHRSRSLPIRKELKTILSKLLRHKDGRVFHGPNGGKIKPDTIRNILIRDVLQPLSNRFPKGVNGKGIAAGRVHSFRHYFCSISADSGVPEQMLMNWLGHRDSAMIRHYYHMRTEESRRQIDAIPFLKTTNGQVTVEPLASSPESHVNPK